MPWKVVKGKGKRPWKIVDAQGKTVGTATSKQMAQASVRARYANTPEARRGR